MATNYYELDGVTFEWDRSKAESNYAKHGVTFEEAASCWGDPMKLSAEDEDHSWEETRLLLIGFSNKANLLLVCHCYREKSGNIRIISARTTTKEEAGYYEKHSYTKGQ